VNKRPYDGLIRFVVINIKDNVDENLNNGYKNKFKYSNYATFIKFKPVGVRYEEKNTR
jgi:hypothetical protein